MPACIENTWMAVLSTGVGACRRCQDNKLFTLPVLDTGVSLVEPEREYGGCLYSARPSTGSGRAEGMIFSARSCFAEEECQPEWEYLDGAEIDFGRVLPYPCRQAQESV